MKYKLILIIIIVINFSCDSQVNNIEIDELAQIDIFENYEDNLKMSNDIVNLNWDGIFYSEIVGYNRDNSKGIKFFINTRPDENKTIIQLRYPHSEKPKNLKKVREIILDEIGLTKKRYLKNKDFILDATLQSEKYFKYLNTGNLTDFYNNFHEQVKNSISIEQFNDFIKQYQEKGISEDSREYHSRLLVKTTGDKSEYVNFIEIHYKHDSMPKNIESFNFQIIDEKEVKLVGYRIY